jgi:DNA repair protein RadC
LKDGAARLRTAELLAILVRSGLPGESALLAGDKIAARYTKHLQQLPDAGLNELKAITRAAGITAYCQIMAGIELGRRVTEARNAHEKKRKKIGTALAARRFCREHFARLASDGAQEEFHVVSLDTRHQVVSTARITIGSLDRSLVHPREVFRPAIRKAAKAVIVVHNHPSGDPTPSTEDFMVAKLLEDAGKTLGIQVLDHVIVARQGTVSIRDHAMRTPTSRS